MEKIDSIFDDRVPVAAAAKMGDISIAAVSWLVVSEHLPRIKALHFLPGWERREIEKFQMSTHVELMRYEYALSLKLRQRDYGVSSGAFLTLVEG